MARISIFLFPQAFWVFLLLFTHILGSHTCLSAKMQHGNMVVSVYFTQGDVQKFTVPWLLTKKREHCLSGQWYGSTMADVTALAVFFDRGGSRMLSPEGIAAVLSEPSVKRCISACIFEKCCRAF